MPPPLQIMSLKNGGFTNIPSHDSFRLPERRLGSRKEGPQRQPCLFASVRKSADISAKTLLNMSYNAERPTGDPDVSESTTGGFFSSDFQR